VRLGVISDIHGIAGALGAVLGEGERLGVERWWVLGDLVLLGPHPVEVLEMLADLDDVAFVAGNTDRYVLTDDQPHPHATPEAAMVDVDLVRRYGLMAAGAAWTRGVLDQAGALELLEELPDRQSTRLLDGTRLLGVHASPASDDGRGFDTTSTDHEIGHLLVGVETDWVVGGHTHDPTDREVGGIRVLNPGSVGLPRVCGSARWMLIDSRPDGAEVEHRSVEFDVHSVVKSLYRRRHPNREYNPFEYSLLEYALLGRAPHLHPLELPGATDCQIAQTALERVGLADRAHQSIHTLSGGEHQLLLIARALAQQPALLLLDEPTAHLDLSNKRLLVRQLRSLAAEGVTILLTTHDPDVAAALAAQLILMRSGRVLRAGPLAEVWNDADLSAAYGVPLRTRQLDGKRLLLWDD